MSYPLIITGAGASYDFQHLSTYQGTSEWDKLNKWQPPQTNNIFNVGKFYPLLSKYSEMDKIVSLITSKLRQTNPKTFEQILTKLYLEGVKRDPDLYVSFMSLLFYLSDLFTTINKEYYRPHNNYSALMKIINLNGNRALFVNFNYDLLLEKVLGKTNIKYIDEYILGDFPVIKVHGASNWYYGRHVNAWGDDKESCYKLSLNYAKNLIKPIQDETSHKIVICDTSNPKMLSTQNVDLISAFSYHPAIALPLLDKDNFVCPSAHIDFLKNHLKKIDRIVIIGWKLGDPLVKELLLNELKERNIPIAFVGGSNSQTVIDGLDKKIQQNIKLINDKGFSDFVGSDAGEDFFS